MPSPARARRARTPEIAALDRDGGHLSCAAKTCSGTGLDTLRRWLGDGQAEVLLLTDGTGTPLVLLDWATWTRVARTVVNGYFPDEPQQPGYNHSVLAKAR